MKKLSIHEWSALSQIVSAVAVVLSLLYVGVEIRSNTEATRAATRQSVAESDFAYFGAAIPPELVVDGLSKMLARDSLDAREDAALSMWQSLNFRIFENAHYQFSVGLLEPEVWERYRSVINFHLNYNPAAQAMWSQSGWSFDESFRDEVEMIRTEPAINVAPGGSAP